jgi:dTDP-4-amino-4,6-dideoxygalactose transaminase
MSAARTATEPLAIDGGPPAFARRTGVPQPKIGVEEFLALAVRFGFNAAALDRLRAAVSDDDLPPGGPTLSRYLTANPSPGSGELYEAAVRAKYGVRHAWGVSSGSAALHCAMIAVGAGSGTEVICPAIGFVATSMSAALVGATPVFCDVDESLHLDPTKLEALITPRTVAVVPTHHWGGVCDLAPVIDIARRHGIKVIEDCAQSPGASYRGRYVGTHGDLGCFSISAYKISGAGEGGLLICDDDALFERACQLGEAGGLTRPDRFAPERYPGELFAGTNYRLSDLEATLDLVQLGKLDDVVAHYRAVSRRIKAQLGQYAEIVWQKSNDPDGDIGYTLRFFPQTHELAARIAAALGAEGIGAGYRGPNAGPDWHVYRYMYPLFAQHAERCRPELCPVATDLFDRELRIGLDQWWSEADCDAVAAGIGKVLGAYCG